MHKITIGNKKRGATGEYVGRPSALGNPFTSKSYGLGQPVASVQASIDAYENWLEERIEQNDPAVLRELTRLHAIASKRDLTLVCWCHPNPCHADVIKKVLLRATLE